MPKKNEVTLQFKIVVLGNSGVGKSTLLHRYIHGSYSPYIKPNACEEADDIRLVRHEKRVKLTIWDTAGQERYRSLTDSYFRDASGALLIFDVTSERSFNDVKQWYDHIKTIPKSNIVSSNTALILVGTKSHETEKRVIPEERAKKLAHEFGQGLEYIEVSAEKNINVQLLFETLVDKMIGHFEESNSGIQEKILVRSTASVNKKDSNSTGCCVIL